MVQANLADPGPSPEVATRVSEGGPTIEIRLRRLQQLFNSLDPSPFRERDLDQDAEDYIVESADEYPLPAPINLVVYLPEEELTQSQAFDLPLSVHNYFAYRLSEGQRRLRLFFREGRIALSIGVAFLFVCVLVRQLMLATRAGAISEIVAEGLLIVGWVAMWRPLEIFLYEWWPIRRRCRILAKLAIIPVTVRPSKG